MKKIRALICAIVIAIGLSGCQTKVENNPTYHLLYFYIEGCQNCLAFEEEMLPMIEEEFGDSIEITKYSLDQVSTREPYEEVLANIEGFDEEEYYGLGPFIVLEGYFGKLGVVSGDGEELLQDLLRAVNGEPLGTALSERRYLYTETKVVQ